MLGALILGDFAVQARWLVPEVLVYMAFVAVANYAQHSYEMGYATKLCRMLLLVLIWLWDWWGFAAGIVITLTLIVTAKPLVGKGYLYPLIPFDRKKLARLLYRRPVTKRTAEANVSPLRHKLQKRKRPRRFLFNSHTVYPGPPGGKTASPPRRNHVSGP